MDQPLTLDVIKREIGAWVNKYLDVPSDHYKGNKPCPFAAMAMKLGKVEIFLLDDPEQLADKYVEFAQSPAHLFVCAFAEPWSDLEGIVQKMNVEAAKDNVWAAAMDPGCVGPEDPCLDPNKWGQETEQAYPIVLIQSLSETASACECLRRQGYYDNLPEHFQEYVQERQDLDHARRKENDG